MRALAEFIMRGRAQAATVAVLGSFVPFVSPGTVALVSLRHGGLDGLYIAAWAILPAVALTVANPASLPMAFYSLCVLVAAVGGAIVLRSQSLWSSSLFGLLILSAMSGAIYGMSFAEFNAELVAQINEQASEETTEGAEPLEVTSTATTGLMAMLVAVNAVVALVIGRWWQAMLYNPGGFRQEFHEFRLTKTQSLFCFGLMAIGMAQANWLFWGLLAGLPLFMVCAAVVHNRVYAKGAGVPWLVLFYLLVLVQPFVLLALVAGFSDAWVDFRKRIGPQLPENGDGDPDRQ